jgi:hypothetical protein
MKAKKIVGKWMKRAKGERERESEKIINKNWNWRKWMKIRD